jgi:hypothetical protein
MKLEPDIQEIANRFNEDEAIWQRYQQKRLVRRFSEYETALPETILDYVDWIEAEREVCVTWAVSRFPAARANAIER